MINSKQLTVKSGVWRTNATAVRKVPLCTALMLKTYAVAGRYAMPVCVPKAAQTSAVHHASSGAVRVASITRSHSASLLKICVETRTASRPCSVTMRQRIPCLL